MKPPTLVHRARQADDAYTVAVLGPGGGSTATPVLLQPPQFRGHP